MTDHVTVVKCGGGRTLDREAVCRDLAALSAAGGPVVLVHGGAADADQLAGRLGVPQRRLTTPSGSSSRYTDPATLEVLLMALAGKIKPGLVAALARHGARAAGLTGMDGNLLRAKRTATHRAVLDGRTVVVRDDHNGRIRAVDPAILTTLLDRGIVPVVSPPALGEDSQPVNVDADRAAAAIAAALSTVVPATLVLLTAAPGVLADHTDERTLLPDFRVPPAGPVGAEATGGMTVKLQAARDALLGGVGTVVIADGRGDSPVSNALAGAGTRVRVAELAGSH
ncbi:[LysW]-aminoadipate kinase [Goodfellowiella coeruleoviolacea]|uniref:N-acetylglutamate kinase n=1 Tax=Goodfellowiella coeruleoviolacea TaxID=334858 RepID=A0AAE3GGF8_9PSEU|nr:[LysW]-aminoadipate kinase [Goodfellowiella coeruleoviolacea]MCP2166899.1 N-acetylglutamate kinase [Goodfellowiella coeruleoviolacea]